MKVMLALGGRLINYIAFDPALHFQSSKCCGDEGMRFTR